MPGISEEPAEGFGYGGREGMATVHGVKCGLFCLQTQCLRVWEDAESGDLRLRDGNELQTFLWFQLLPVSVAQ